MIFYIIKLSGQLKSILNYKMQLYSIRNKIQTMTDDQCLFIETTKQVDINLRIKLHDYLSILLGIEIELNDEIFKHKKEYT